MPGLNGVFAAFGLSVSAGLNAYVPLLIVALIARFTDWIELASPWDILSSGWVIGVIVLLGVIEFFVDKIPAVNHINDAVQTFIRPVAGAVLFAARGCACDQSHRRAPGGYGRDRRGGQCAGEHRRGHCGHDALDPGCDSAGDRRRVHHPVHGVCDLVALAQGEQAA